MARRAHSYHPMHHPKRFLFLALAAPVVLTASLFADETMDATLVAEVTARGASLAPPTSNRPAYCAIYDGGYIETLSSISGEKPPTASTVAQSLRTALAQSGYAPATTEHPASIALIYHWGIVRHEGWNDRTLLTLVTPARMTERLKFRYPARSDPIRSDPVRTQIPISFQEQQVIDQIVSSYFVTISAYDLADLEHGKETPLWRLKLSTRDRGKTMEQAITSLLPAADGYFGRGLETTSHLQAPIVTAANNTSPAALAETIPSIDRTPIDAIISRQRAAFNGERDPVLDDEPFLATGSHNVSEARARTLFSSGRTPYASIAFFPPIVPVYGAALSNESSIRSVNGQIVNAPGRLADYVNEDFYPALGGRLVAGELDPKLDRRLEAYRATRTDLVNRLLEQIEATRSQSTEGREHNLQALAQIQAPALVALESEAEQLRCELLGSEPGSKLSWNEHRNWRLGVTSFPTPFVALAAEFQVMRATAFYEKGLSSEQRGLLHELATELAEKINSPTRPDSDPMVGMYFSPAPARVRFPGNLPRELTEKIGAYNRERIALQTELRDTVRDLEQTASPTKRRAAFEALADRQHARFATQEILAEEIRRGLAALPEAPPAATAMPHLPAGLAERIDAYRREKLALNTELNRRLVLTRSRFSARASAQTRSAITPTERLLLAQTTADPSIVGQALAQTNAEFKTEKTARYEALQHSGEAIRRDLVSFAHHQTDPATGQPLDPDALMRTFHAAAERFDRLGREEGIYRTYRIATLQPGLSPAQRRLLFGAALIELVQPLPSGEPVPDSEQLYPTR